jgi:hypothetical protein
MNFITEDFKPSFLGGPDLVIIKNMDKAQRHLEAVESALEEKYQNAPTKDKAYWYRALLELRKALNANINTEKLLEGEN